MFTEQQKLLLKQQLVSSLGTQPEVLRIVVFGSFLTSSDPNDLDVAIFQNTDEQYLPLAMKYRKMTRHIARVIPLDIVPLRMNAASGIFTDEISQGEIIYERAD
jgi:predicted nucleotidyltransferase